VADTATLGARTIPIHESVIFGPVKDGAHQQYDYVDPGPSIIIGFQPPDPAYAAIDAKAAALGTEFTGASTEPTQRLGLGRTHRRERLPPAIRELHDLLLRRRSRRGGRTLGRPVGFRRS